MHFKNSVGAMHTGLWKMCAKPFWIATIKQKLPDGVFVSLKMFAGIC